jgi:hypothetical protein
VWNDHFCDQQLRGPFAYWHHCHQVQPQTRTDSSGAPISGTLLHDEVKYELPLGKLGDIANRIINWQLHKTFAYRHSRTLELLRSQVHTHLLKNIPETRTARNAWPAPAPSSCSDKVSISQAPPQP